MLETMDQLYREVYNIWKNHNVGESNLCWDERFHSARTIENRDVAADQLQEASIEGGLQNISCLRPMEYLSSLEPDCSCFDLVFKELRAAIDNDDVLLLGNDDFNGKSYYVGMLLDPDEEDEADPASCFIYETSYTTDCDTDYLDDKLIVYGSSPEFDPLDGYFKMVVCGNSERVHSEQSMSTETTMTYWMLHTYFANNK